MRHLFPRPFLLALALAAPLAGLVAWVGVNADDGKKPATASVQAFRVPQGKAIRVVSAPDGVITLTIEDVGPVPDPEPTPPPPPKPQPVPTRCWLVVVEETAEAAANRGLYFQDKELRGYLSAKGWKLRLADKDVVDRSGRPPADLKPWLDRAKGKVLPYAAVVDQDGAVRSEGVLPANVADLVKTLRTIGGD